MPVINIQCACGCSEWLMLELQGEIEGTDPSLGLDGLSVGVICSSSAESIQLNIGYHQLEGKAVRLKLPIAVMRSERTADGDESSLQYTVVGVVRKKFHFKDRPKALISNPATGGAKRQKQAFPATFFAHPAAKANGAKAAGPASAAAAEGQETDEPPAVAV